MPPTTPPDSGATDAEPPSTTASPVSPPDAALQASEVRYRALATASADVIYRMSPDWREMHQLDGRGFLADTPEPSLTWIETYILPDDQPHVSAAIAEAVRTGTPFELEHRVRLADGGVGWTHSRAVPIRDEKGTVVEWIGAARDVTTQRVAEEQLRESEARYRALFQSMDEAYAVVEVLKDDAGAWADFRFIEVNPAFVEHTGMPWPVGQTATELLGSPNPRWAQLYGQVLDTGEPIRVEEAEPTLGRTFDLSIFTLDRARDRVAVLFTNITERRRAEQQLRESKERLQKALSIETVGVLFFTLGGGITDANAALARMTGYTREELCALDDWSVLTPPEFQEPTERAASELATRGRTAPYEKQWIRKDGSRFWGLFAPTRLSGSGQQSECVEFIVDITDLKTAETALLESEERYRRIVDHATDYAIFSTDAERRIETWSLGAEVTFGWTPEEVIGQLMDITFTLEDQASGHIEREIAQAREEGSAPNVRWHQRKDGTLVFIDGTSYARQAENGTFQGIFKVGQDVTARVQAEEARRETEVRYREALEAEIAAATVELRTLSRRLLMVQEDERRKLALELHDEIGQVLTGLSYQLAAAQGANGARALADAEKTVQALTAQVRQMALALRPEVLDRYGLLAALEWHFERFQTQTGITVHLRHQGLTQRFTLEVEIAAFRVVQEALTNVARHSGVDFATVHVHGDEDGGLTLVIRDAGQGFDPAQHSNSSGLGGMRERVELLGGRLEIESAPGEGTTVIAELPADIR